MPAKSKAQQRLFGMVHAYQKGKLKHAPASVKRIAKHISKEDARHFAETKHDGLPETKKAEVVMMTRYEQGFLTKCAEAGLTMGESMRLMKRSFDVRPITEARKFKILSKLSALLSKKPELYDRVMNKFTRGWSGEMEYLLGEARDARLKAVEAAGQAIKKNPKKFGHLSEVLNKSKKQLWPAGDDFINNDVARSQIADALEKVKPDIGHIVDWDNGVDMFKDRVLSERWG